MDNPTCKCGRPMEDINHALLPGEDDYKWTCPAQRWWNYLFHSAPFEDENQKQMNKHCEE